MSAKAPRGERMVEKEWTTVEPDSEIKLVQVSEGTVRARFLSKIRGLGWFVNCLCLLVYGIPRSILKVLS